MTHTYVKTYALMDAWAQSFPWDCLIRPTNCCSPTHDHAVMVDDICAAPQCDEPLKDREACYRVVQVEGYVCWRHVHPDDGPLLYPAGA
jgi:hypothetical protein